MTNKRDSHLDQELSALLDGELSAARQSALRRKVDSDATLRGRLEALSAVDDALEGLAAREVPPDLGPRLRERITRDRRDLGLRVRSEGKAVGTPRRRDRNWGAVGVGVMAAAAATLYLWTPAPLQREIGPDAGAAASIELVPVDVAETATAPSSAKFLAEPNEFEDASEEEVAIAFQYPMLTDLDLIEELEMLELLEALDEGRPRG